MNIDVYVLPDRNTPIQFEVQSDIKCGQLKALIQNRLKASNDFDIKINDVIIDESISINSVQINSTTDLIFVVYRVIEEQKREYIEVKKLGSFVNKTFSNLTAKSTQSNQGLMNKLMDKSRNATKKVNRQEIVPVSQQTQSYQKLSLFVTKLPQKVMQQSKTQTSSFMDKIRATQIAKIQDVKEKDDENPSIIQQNEEEQEYKNQNDTVLNILDNLDDLGLPIKRPFNLKDGIVEYTIKNQKSGILVKTAYPPSAIAQQFKDRQDKARKEFNDPKSHERSQQLLQKLESQRKGVEQRRQINYLKQNQDLNVSIEHQRKQREDLMIQMKDKKRQEIQLKLDEDRQKRITQKQINFESNKLLKALKRESNEDKEYKLRNQNVEINQELQRRKLVLEKKREMYRPVSLQQLHQHAKNHDENIKLLRMERDREKIERDIDYDRKMVKVQRSIFTSIIETEDKMKKNLLEDKKKEKRLLLARKMKYAEVVKDMFQPKLRDRSKELQAIQQKELLDLSTQQYYEFDEYVKVKRLAQNMSKSPRSKNQQKMLDEHLNKIQFRGFLSDEDNVKKIGRALEQTSHQNDSTGKTPEKNSPIAKDKLPTAFRPPLLPKTKKFEAIALPVVQLPLKVNYLAELRTRREEKEKTQPDRPEGWQKIVNNDNSIPQEKYFTNVLSTIQKMEFKAKQKEQLNQQDEANELYINSIKAKLALLQV